MLRLRAGAGAGHAATGDTGLQATPGFVLIAARSCCGYALVLVLAAQVHPIEQQATPGFVLIAARSRCGYALVLGSQRGRLFG